MEAHWGLVFKRKRKKKIHRATSVSSHQCGKLVYMLPPTWTYPTGRSPHGHAPGWEAGVDVLAKIICQHAMLEIRRRDFLCLTFEYMASVGFYYFTFPLLITWTSIWQCAELWTGEFQLLVNFKMTNSVFSTSCFVFCFIFLRLLEKDVLFDLLLWSTARSLETITVCNALVGFHIY